MLDIYCLEKGLKVTIVNPAKFSTEIKSTIS